MWGTLLFWYSFYTCVPSSLAIVWNGWTLAWCVSLGSLMLVVGLSCVLCHIFLGWVVTSGVLPCSCHFLQNLFCIGYCQCWAFLTTYRLVVLIGVGVGGDRLGLWSMMGSTVGYTMGYTTRGGMMVVCWWYNIQYTMLGLNFGDCEWISEFLKMNLKSISENHLLKKIKKIDVLLCTLV